MNFFKSYFYGKSGQKDFTENDLPANRKQLFRTVLSVRRGSMVGLNLLYLLFWLPAAFWTFLNLMQLTAVAEGTVQAGDLLYSYLLVLFPLVTLTGPFTMGIARVMRNWARDEHSFAVSDFFRGVRENWKQGLLMSIIEGGLPLLLFVCIDVYAAMSGSLLMYLPVAVLLIAALLWVLSAQLLPTMIVTYEQGFFTMVRNAVLMTLAELPRAILAKLSTLIMPLILLVCTLAFPIALNWVSLVAAILYALFQLSFNKLITASFANALCEKYLNTKIEGAGVNIGLRKKD